jgi:hypothetical protein
MSAKGGGTLARTSRRRMHRVVCARCARVCAACCTLVLTKTHPPLPPAAARHLRRPRVPVEVSTEITQTLINKLEDDDEFEEFENEWTQKELSVDTQQKQWNDDWCVRASECARGRAAAWRCDKRATAGARRFVLLQRFLLRYCAY